LIQVKDDGGTVGHGGVQLWRTAMIGMDRERRIGPGADLARGWNVLLRAVRDRWTTASDVARLDDHEVADLGISRNELQAIVRAGTQPRRLMTAMMARIGVRPSDLRRISGLTREVERTCALCAEKRRCRRWLKAEQPSQDYRSFCPNAASFERARAARA
jgi:uncharacterized protein YjiS (DUF1127 family)